MTDKYNDEIIEEENQDTDDQTDDYEPEKFCTLCHRSERQAGKIFRIIYIYVRTACREVSTA